MQIAIALSNNQFGASDSIADHQIIPDTDYTIAQLAKAVAEAQDFHKKFLVTTHVTEHGLITSDKPDWAKSILRKKSCSDAVVEKVGAAILAKRRPSDIAPYCTYVQDCFDRKEPITFRIVFGPLKNVNLPMCQQSPDLAEYLTFVHLTRLLSAVSILYPYGVKAHIVPDNMRAQTANRCPVESVRSYINGLIKLADGLGFNKWMTIEEDQMRLYEDYHVEKYRMQAEEQLQQWKQMDATSFDVKWQSACWNARKNIPKAYADDINEVESAAWRYLITHRAEILSGMWSPGEAFPLIYANHPNAYQIYSLDYKKTKLPWQIALPTSLLPDVKIPGLNV